MPSLKAIRRRIASVKNTQKITRAMKLVSAAKLRRAQQAAEETRHYAMAIDEIIGRLAARVDTKAHPLLKPRDVKTVNLLVITSDRGLAGAYNGNVLRRAEEFVKRAEKSGQTVKVTAIGKRARDNRFLRPYLLDFITDIGTGLSYGTAELLADRVVPRFLASEPVDVTGDGVADTTRGALEAQASAGDGARSAAEVVPVDAVVVIYTRFKSALTQVVVEQQLLPMKPLELAADDSRIDYKYEPGQKELLDALLPRHLKMQLFRALLESTASEHGARMTAMDNASNNAADMIGRLTLQMNRARQAIITKELMEIVSGKEALEG